MAERLLRRPEVLARVGLGKSKWYDLIREGKAPSPMHIGKTSVWAESSVDRFIADVCDRKLAA